MSRSAPSALVTGGNRGIGLALCTALAEEGWEVIATCRRTSPELVALGVRVVEGVDVTDRAATGRIRAAVGDGRVDLLCVNAGVNLSFDADGVDELDLDAVEAELRINAVGAARTALAALPNLAPGSKVLFVSSGVVGPGAQSRGHIGYAASKAALNAFARSFASEVEPRGIVVVIATPGSTETDMLRRVVESSATAPSARTPVQDPREGARKLLGIVRQATLETSGTFWSPDGEVILTADGIPPGTAVAR